MTRYTSFKDARKELKRTVEDSILPTLEGWVCLTYGTWYDVYTLTCVITALLFKLHLINPRINYMEY